MKNTFSVSTLRHRSQPLGWAVVWLTLFSAAMGYLETAVVVYLRELYYPDGFRFPLVPLPARVALVEIGREVATLVMLVGVGVLFGRNRSERFAGFLYSFAIWDLTYYLSLKLLLEWPDSWLTLDILFLIPVPWVGPVLAPCLLSCTMIALAAVVVRQLSRGVRVPIGWREWALLTAGSLVACFSFIGEYARHAGQRSAGGPLFSEAAGYVPGPFDWWTFLAGELLLGWAICRIARVPPATTSTKRRASLANTSEESECFSDYLNSL